MNDATVKRFSKVQWETASTLWELSMKFLLVCHFSWFYWHLKILYFVVGCRVPCKKKSGVRFTISGSNYFQLVLVTNVAGAGSIQAVSIKGSKTGWLRLSNNWGVNWQSNNNLNGQSLSFSVITTDGVTKVFQDVAPSNWCAGLTYSSPLQF